MIDLDALEKRYAFDPETEVVCGATEALLPLIQRLREVEAENRLWRKCQEQGYLSDELGRAETRILQLERVREAAVWLVQSWGDGPKDVSGDTTVEGDLRAALAAVK